MIINDGLQLGRVMINSQEVKRIIKKRLFCFIRQQIKHGVKWLMDTMFLFWAAKSFSTLWLGKVFDRIILYMCLFFCPDNCHIIQVLRNSNLAKRTRDIPLHEGTYSIQSCKENERDSATCTRQQIRYSER